MTHANLIAALAGEAMAGLRYRLYADRADQEGFDEVAGLFDSIAREERREHALEIARLLGVVGPTRQNLARTIEGETTEHRLLYPEFAAQARRVGDLDAAALFEALGAAEHVNAERLRAALARLAFATGVPARR